MQFNKRIRMGEGARRRKGRHKGTEENTTGGRACAQGGAHVSADRGGGGRKFSEAILIPFNCLPQLIQK